MKIVPFLLVLAGLGLAGCGDSNPKPEKTGGSAATSKSTAGTGSGTNAPDAGTTGAGTNAQGGW